MFSHASRGFLRRHVVVATATAAPTATTNTAITVRCLSTLPIFERAARKHPTRTAVVDANGTKYTYHRLIKDSCTVAQQLMKHAGGPLDGKRIAFLSPPTYDYVAMQWGIWQSGGVAVPLSTHHTNAELTYFIKDSECSAVLAHPTVHAQVPADIPPLLLAAPSRDISNCGGVEENRLPDLDINNDAMIIYTSGTTGKPKGVVTTHKNIDTQITTLVDAWGWTQNDRTMNVLPLHHVHGIVNVLCCALYAGACVEMPLKFDPLATLNAMIDRRLSVFMAVPTVYTLLLRHISQESPEAQQTIHESMEQMRLMVCGSAALPSPVAERWLKASGHVLLQRYGMTEIGMALSQPLHGPRHLGTVGTPLPGVEVCIAGDVQDTPEATVGELRVKGDSVFSRYYNRPEATAESFDAKGYFCTGDIVRYDKKNGQFSILGRASVDIIKSGGYKISALEIEPEILTHPAVREVAVLGVPDQQWGERIAAVIVLQPHASLTLEDLRAHCHKTLATYKLPSVLKIFPEIPRNALGKINKKELAKKL